MVKIFPPALNLAIFCLGIVVFAGPKATNAQDNLLVPRVVV